MPDKNENLPYPESCINSNYIKCTLTRTKRDLFITLGIGAQSVQHCSISRRDVRTEQKENPENAKFGGGFP